MVEGVEVALVPTVFNSCGWFYTVPWYFASKELKIHVDLAVVCDFFRALSLGKGACCLCFVVAAADFVSKSSLVEVTGSDLFWKLLSQYPRRA